MSDNLPCTTHELKGTAYCGNMEHHKLLVICVVVHVGKYLDYAVWAEKGEVAPGLLAAFVVRFCMTHFWHHQFGETEWCTFKQYVLINKTDQQFRAKRNHAQDRTTQPSNADLSNKESALYQRLPSQIWILSEFVRMRIWHVYSTRTTDVQTGVVVSSMAALESRACAI